MAKRKLRDAYPDAVGFSAAAIAAPSPLGWSAPTRRLLPRPFLGIFFLVLTLLIPCRCDVSDCTFWLWPLSPRRCQNVEEYLLLGLVGLGRLVGLVVVFCLWEVEKI